MRKTMLAISLILGININLFASGFGALLYAPTGEDKTLEGVEFTDLSYYKLKFGSIGYTQGIKRFGYYVDIGFASPKDKESQQYKEMTSDVKYYNYLLNAGSTFSLSDHIVLFGGVGVEYQIIEYTDFAEKKESETNFNMNGGAMWFYKSYGLIAGFDSANKAMNFGFTYKF